MAAQAPGDSLWFVASNDGKVLRSTDAGEQWSYSLWDTTKSFSALAFRDVRVGAAIDYYNSIAFTEDGGGTWRFGKPTTSSRLFCAAYTTAGLYVGGNGGIFFSSDQGNTWEKISSLAAVALRINADTLYALSTSSLTRIDLTTKVSDTTYPETGKVFRDLAVTQSNTVVIVGDAGFLTRSTDGGRNFSSIPSPLAVDLSSISAGPNGRLLASGFNRRALISNDKGKNWDVEDLGKIFYPVDYRSVVFTPSGNYFATGTSGSITKYSQDSAKWLQLAHSPFNTSDNIARTFMGLKFVTAKVGFIYGNNGFFLRTQDGGVTWRGVEGERNAYVFDMHCYDSLNAICVAPSSSVMRTNNGGLSWYTDYFNVRSDYYAIKFPFADTSIGFLGVDSGIYKTVDGGRHWFPVLRDTSIMVLRLSFAGHSAIAIGLKRVPGSFSFAGVVVSSADSGVTWRESMNVPHQLKAGVLSADGKGLFCGWFAMVGKTSDGGQTWDTTKVGNAYLYSIYVKDSSSAYLFGEGAQVFKTTDGGNVWEKEFPLPGGLKAYRILGCAVRDSAALFAVGVSTILVKNDAPPTEANVRELPWSPNLYLYVEAYPSPARDKLRIKIHGLYAVTGLPLRMKIYDVLGREVDDMSSEIEANRTTLTSEILYDTSKLPPGGYTIVLGAGEYGKAHKIIVAE